MPNNQVKNIEVSKVTTTVNSSEALKDVKTPEGEDESMLVTKCLGLENLAKDARRKYDWDWMVRTLYVRGFHFAKYNRSANSVSFSPSAGIRIPIGLVSAHLRGVRNQVTSFQPKWEVIPTVTTESAMENARYSGKLLDYMYEKAQIRRKIKEAVTHSLIYSIGVWQFTIDQDGVIKILTLDPYDVLIDPNCKSPNLSDPDMGAEFVIKTMQVPLDAVVKNPKYQNTEYLQADNRPSIAEYKRFIMQVTRQYQETSSEKNPTILLREAWIRERDDEGRISMKVVHYTDSCPLPLLVQKTKESEYPFEVLQGDIVPGEVYGESWVKHLIPINRIIDALESHIFEYNHFFARGRFIIDKNSGVRIIVNQHGQIIEKNRGSVVQPVTVAPLPSSPMEQIANMRRYLEDISGVHDVSLGRLPATIRSGTAIAELKQADATNQADLVDNLEDFLSRAGRKILRLVAENWTTSRLISVTGLGGKPEYFMAMGENGSIKKKGKFSFGSMELPLAIIGQDNEVRVQVGSWLAYTKEARGEKLKELFRLGAIDQKTYLEYAEFSDIDGIYERTRDERLMQMRAGKPNMGVKLRHGGTEIDDESLALAENELMEEGKDMPVEPEDDHEIHLAIHKEKADNDLVKAHLEEHIKQMRWIIASGTRPTAPGEGGAEGTAPPPGGEAAAMGAAPEAMMGGGIPTPPTGGAPAGGGMAITPEILAALGGGQ